MQLGRHLIDEARVEQIQYPLPLDTVSARAGVGRGPGTDARVTPAIQRRPGQAQHATRGRGPKVGVPSVTVTISRPRRSRTVSGGSAGAWKLVCGTRAAHPPCSRDVKRGFSCSSFLSCGSTAGALRPRVFGVNPVSRCWRHVTRWAECSPSGRRRAPARRPGGRPPAGGPPAVGGREGRRTAGRGPRESGCAGRTASSIGGDPPLRGASLRSSPLRSRSPSIDGSSILRILRINVLTPPRPQH